MTVTAKKIKAELKTQEKVLGKSPETQLLLALLPHCKTSREWETMVYVNWYHPAPGAESFRIYKPSQFLLNLLRFTRLPLVNALRNQIIGE